MEREPQEPEEPEEPMCAALALAWSDGESTIPPDSRVFGCVRPAGHSGRHRMRPATATQVFVEDQTWIVLEPEERPGWVVRVLRHWWGPRRTGRDEE